MESERPEVFERIPWETLESKSDDRKWLVYAVAGAVAVGALAYSFARHQPAEIAPTPTQVAAAPAPTIAPQTPSSPVTPTAVAPIVVAEADLYAVDVEAFKTLVASHAEWAAVEYFSSDGQASVLPTDVPSAVVPDGVSVFVDWVGVRDVIETDHLNYRVQVQVRSLVAEGDAAFVRQAPELATFEIGIDSTGQPFVKAPPEVTELGQAAQIELGLIPVPEDLRVSVETEHGPVIGGSMLADGSWRVVVMKVGHGGVQRPVSVFP